ncbi:MAG: anaerobic ribonucleoside-triphosphate reductase activating protein, partial [Candidatus Pacebacteria bacterium]|nr:anaerobic ribonucleoside-triphosphate reductase activating protein [Candidatus Paceibacterota bacterium]
MLAIINLFMIIGGLQKITLIDYPGQLACVVFLVGCNFRCPFCYSSELVLPEKIARQPRMPEKDFFDFLKQRQGQLDGVVICGGEPTINQRLADFCSRIKKLGYKIKLDTNGSNPAVIADLLKKKLLDYVAMDIKAPREKYPQTIGFEGVSSSYLLDNIQKSVDLLKKGSVDYEFRTTFVDRKSVV